MAESALPVEGERVKEKAEPEKPEKQPEETKATKALADPQPGDRRDPKRHRVGEHRRAALRDDVEPKIDEPHADTHLQDADADDDRHVASTRPDGTSLDQHEGCEAKGADPHPERREPERRQILEPDLHDRPVEAPDQHDAGEE